MRRTGLLLLLCQSKSRELARQSVDVRLRFRFKDILELYLLFS